MIRVRSILLTLACFSFVGALAQEQERQMDLLIAVEHETYGAYVTDMEGRTLYAFLTEDGAFDGTLEPMQEGVREEAATCAEACLESWPPLLADIAQEGVAADESLDANLLYTADVAGREQVVYNGWPLYYYVEDQTHGDTLGQGLNGRWFMIAPDGSLIRTEATESQSVDGTDDVDDTEAPGATDGAATDAAPDGPAPGADDAGGDAAPDGPAPGADDADGDGAGSEATDTQD